MRDSVGVTLRVITDASSSAYNLRVVEKLKNCGCSSVDRVLASEAKGRGFDPRQPHHSWGYQTTYLTKSAKRGEFKN